MERVDEDEVGAVLVAGPSAELGEVTEVDAVSWAVNYAVDEDAVAMGIDSDTLSSQILERIGEWNALGRGLCGRFLAEAEGPA